MQLTAEVSGASLEQAEERLRRPGVTVAPRKMWPSALTNLGIDLKGKITEATVIGVIGGRLVVVALNRMALPQGLHAPFVATAALVIFGVTGDLSRKKLMPAIYDLANRGLLRVLRRGMQWVEPAAGTM